MNSARFRIAFTRLAMSAVIAQVLFGVGPATAAPAKSGRDEFAYDPSACKTNAHDKIYIALGPNVLAVPFHAAPALIGAIYPGTGVERLTPPDPTDHEGCPNNPRQLESYGFNYQYNEALAGKGGAKPPSTPHPLYLELVDYLRGNPASSPKQRWPGEESELQIARQTFADATVRERLKNGLTACRVKPRIDLRVEDWGASYIAQTSVYAAPLGQPFVVNCGPVLFSAAVGYCTVAYRIAPGLGLVYHFEPYKGSGPIPIERIVDFDRDLRGQIERSIVNDYAWPDLETTPDRAKTRPQQ